jgi:hypothetical protein
MVKGSHQHQMPHIISGIYCITMIQIDQLPPNHISLENATNQPNHRFRESHMLWHNNNGSGLT